MRASVPQSSTVTDANLARRPRLDESRTSEGMPNIRTHVRQTRTIRPLARPRTLRRGRTLLLPDEIGTTPTARHGYFLRRILPFRVVRGFWGGRVGRFRAWSCSAGMANRAASSCSGMEPVSRRS
jgi:hypothetical protein